MVEGRVQSMIERWHAAAIIREDRRTRRAEIERRLAEGVIAVRRFLGWS